MTWPPSSAKEWTYFRREPQYKAMAVQTVYTLVLLSASIALPSLRRGGWGLLPGDGLLLGVSGVLLLSLLPLLFNIWAGEGAAITVLFSLPTPRRALLLGKNVAHGALLLGVCGVGLTAAAALERAAGRRCRRRGRGWCWPRRCCWRRATWSRSAFRTGCWCGASAGSAAGWPRRGTAPAAPTPSCTCWPTGQRFWRCCPCWPPSLLPGRWGIPALWYALSLPLAAALLGRPLRHPARAGRGLAAGARAGDHAKDRAGGVRPSALAGAQHAAPLPPPVGPRRSRRQNVVPAMLKRSFLVRVE